MKIERGETSPKDGLGFKKVGKIDLKVAEVRGKL